MTRPGCHASILLIVLMFCFLSLCQGKLLAVPNMKVAHIIIKFLEEMFFQGNRNPSVGVVHSRIPEDFPLSFFCHLSLAGAIFALLMCRSLGEKLLCQAQECQRISLLQHEVEHVQGWLRPGLCQLQSLLLKVLFPV